MVTDCVPFFFLAKKQGNIVFILQIYSTTMTTTINELLEFFHKPIATSFNELLGEQLLEHNESNNELNQISTNQLNGKTIGFCFASVCN